MTGERDFSKERRRRLMERAGEGTGGPTGHLSKPGMGSSPKQRAAAREREREYVENADRVQREMRERVRARMKL